MKAPALRCVLALILLSSIADVLLGDVTGSWNGTQTFTTRCENGMTHTTQVPVSMLLTQQGEAFSGMALARLTFLSEQCQVEQQADAAMPIVGQVSGTTLSATVSGPTGQIAVNGTVNGDSMSLELSGGEGSGSATLSRSGTGAPDLGLTGIYVGTYTDVVNLSQRCSNLSTVTLGGPLTTTLFHTGTTVTGTIILRESDDIHDTEGVCTIVGKEDEEVFFSGRLDGDEINGFLADEEPEPFTATVNGNTITFVSVDDQGTQTMTMTRVAASTAPAIVRFEADPVSIAAGESSTLRWDAVNATSVTLDQAIGAVTASGSLVVAPIVSTTYTLIAAGPGGSATRSVTVALSQSGTPLVVLSATPRGMVQVPGEPATDSFTLTNVGGASTTVALALTNPFFEQSPSMFTLPAGASQVVAVTASSPQPGQFVGSSVPSGNGVATEPIVIRLFVSAVPSGTVDPRPSATRVEITGTVGSASVTNMGSATVQAVVSSDASWISATSDFVTIEPAQTKSISFNVDPSGRPDGEAPLGGASAALSLRFLRGSESTGAVSTDETGVSIGTVNVTLVHVVSPGASGATPDPLGANELALFAPGLSSAQGEMGDLAFSSFSSETPDLQLFYSSSFAGTFYQRATLASITPNVNVTFPSLVRSVFGQNSQTGTVMLRGTDIRNMAVAAKRINTADSAGTFGGAIPVFRSDDGVAAGGRIFLTGTFRGKGAFTNIYVQELTGKLASQVQIDFLDASGNVVSSRPAESMGPFGFRVIEDAVPDGAVATRVTSVPGGEGRIAAYALVVVPPSREFFVSEDSAASAGASTFFMPIVSAGAGAETYVFATNRTSGSVSATFDVRSGGRRRAVRTSSTSGSSGVLRASMATPVSIAPSATIGKLVEEGSGYMRIDAPAGSLALSGRTFVGRAAGRVLPWGTTLPVVPSSAALVLGDMRRFAAVDDSSAATANASAPGTYSSNLLLLETTGSTAVVRVTLRYSFASGGLVSGITGSSRDFTLAPSQSRTIRNLARSIIGPLRDTFGDLRDMQVDVAVIAGSGAVLPFIQSIDNGSDDMNVRAN